MPLMLAATGGPPCAAFDGKLSSKACPQGFAPVTTEAACQSLAAIGGKSYVGSVNVSSLPSGCFWLNVGGGVYWNTHAEGGPNPNAQKLCAGGAPSPPSHAQARIPAHSCLHTHAATCNCARRRVGTSALRLVGVTKLLLRMRLRPQGPMQTRRRQRSALSAVRPLNRDARRMARTA